MDGIFSIFSNIDELDHTRANTQATLDMKENLSADGSVEKTNARQR